MKFRKDRDILIFLGISIAMILSGAILSIFFRPPPFGLILAGLVLFISGLFAASKPRTEVMMDERVKRINEKAGYHAYWMMMSAVGFLWVADIYLPMNMKLWEGMNIIAFIGIFSFFILRYYFEKKGGVE